MARQRKAVSAEKAEQLAIQAAAKRQSEAEASEGTEDQEEGRDVGKVFTDLAEARAADVPGKRRRLAAVTRGDGTVVYTWGRSKWHALGAAAADAGWTSEWLDKALGKDVLAAGLAALSPEDRAILIAQFVPPTGGKRGNGGNGKGKELFGQEGPYGGDKR
jgi:hypothetical protein